MRKVAPSNMLAAGRVLQGEYQAVDGHSYHYAAVIDEDDRSIGLRDVQVRRVADGHMPRLPPSSRLPAPPPQHYLEHAERLLRRMIDHAVSATPAR